MAYLLSKVFPFIWPYLKELLAGWIKHPYFDRNGYKMAMKKFGILFLFIAFIVIGSEYVATLRELELIKEEVKSKPPAYVSFDDVKNYHELFDSPEIRKSLEECRNEVLDLNSRLIEKTHLLQLEKTLHAKTMDDLTEARMRNHPTPLDKPVKSNRDRLNDRLNPKKD